MKQIIAVYPGRFQPMGKHHKATYDWMVSTFGIDNSFIVTSDKVCLPDSPFCYDDKFKIAQAFGIPPQSISKERVVYAPATFSFMKDKDPETTAVVIIVGKKDMEDSYDPKTGNVEKARFVKGENMDGIKKNGQPTYFKEYIEGIPLEGFKKHGYIMLAPHQQVDVGGKEMSGSALRSYLPLASDQDFDDAMGFSDAGVRDLIRGKLSEGGLLESVIYGNREIDDVIRTVFIKGLMR